MDGLIALLVVIAVVNALTSGKRKKRQEAQRRAFQGAQQAQAAAQKPKARPARQRLRPQSRPSTPEELRAHLAAMDARSKPMPQSSAPKREEGSASTQGESEAEHAEHRRRIAAEEAARRLEHEALRDLREANREKLRTAVIMSEVLGKPVSLRPRTGYHR